jgi:hypothetical protein
VASLDKGLLFQVGRGAWSLERQEGKRETRTGSYGHRE